ncbi:MAG TPA: antibiotic biosynthesis monooxygenase [Acidobacteriaceae bacterium]|jgi:heme-degrading monooxygenase HmoA|nr:antibiotic biosynthesis monooxygenase [Acidobacteriaceae bacterium]
MVLEVAQLQVKAGEEAEFEAAMRRAAPVIAGAQGYIGHELRRCVETPGRYLLLVRWETLEAHTVGFRGSAAFGEWRAIIGPFFASAPVVEHYESVLSWPQGSSGPASQTPVS